MIFEKINILQKEYYSEDAWKIFLSSFDNSTPNTLLNEVISLKDVMSDEDITSFCFEFKKIYNKNKFNKILECLYHNKTYDKIYFHFYHLFLLSMVKI